MIAKLKSYVSDCGISHSTLEDHKEQDAEWAVIPKLKLSNISTNEQDHRLQEIDYRTNYDPVTPIYCVRHANDIQSLPQPIFFFFGNLLQQQHESENGSQYEIVGAKNIHDVHVLVDTVNRSWEIRI